MSPLSDRLGSPEAVVMEGSRVVLRVGTLMEA